jgi:hypothetical protein
MMKILMIIATNPNPFLSSLPLNLTLTFPTLIIITGAYYLFFGSSKSGGSAVAGGLSTSREQTRRGRG